MQFIHSNQDSIRIGLFICHCGSNIASVVDCESLTEYGSTLSGVVYTINNLYTCSESGIRQIMESIGTYDLNRVVVASCSPRTHQPLFQSACREAGLNPYLFEMVNIRDQCSWVHAKDREKANKKARDLVRMGVAKAGSLKPRRDIESSLVPSALVIGGGIAGLSAANAMADMGLHVFLIEKEPQPGGLLRDLYQLAPGERSSPLHIKDLIEAVESAPNITLLTSSQILSVTGYIGNFEFIAKRSTKDNLAQDEPDNTAEREKTTPTPDKKSSTDKSEEIIREKAGCIIVATGALPYQPEREFGYNGETIITQMELERQFAGTTFNSKKVVMIQCVGSRMAGREYCSRICCMTAVKNAMVIKKRNPDAQVHILYRDMQMYGTQHEKMLWDARGMGIKFEGYDKKRPPVVKNGTVSFHHPLMGEVRKIPYDLTVLSTPLTPRKGSTALARLMKLSVDLDGFFLEAHAKLRPLDFSSDGIFVCGSARYPATSMEARTEGVGAASRAAAVLFKEKLIKSAIVAEINPQTCVMCEECLKICPFEAISTNLEKRICQVNQILCKGCGSCAAVCPSQSAGLAGFQHQQLFAQIRAVC